MNNLNKSSRIAKYLDQINNGKEPEDKSTDEEEKLLAEIRQLKEDIRRERESRVEKSRRKTKSDRIAAYLDKAKGSK